MVAGGKAEKENVEKRGGGAKLLNEIPIPT